MLDGDRSGLPGGLQPSSLIDSGDDASRTLVGQRGRAKRTGAGAHSRQSGGRPSHQSAASRDERPAIETVACSSMPPSMSDATLAFEARVLILVDKAILSPRPKGRTAMHPGERESDDYRGPHHAAAAPAGASGSAPMTRARSGLRSVHRASPALHPLVR